MRRSVSAELPPVTYEIQHTTRYSYADSVTVSHHLARLSPRQLGDRQMCLQHTLQIQPEPAVRATHADYFGNDATFFAMQGAHKGLTVTARSIVRVVPACAPVAARTPAWEIAADRTALPLDALEALFDSTSIRATREFTEYARPSFPPGRPFLEALLDLTARIYGDFTFDPGATTVTTPLPEVFRLRRGVCQDFARLEIACLRSIGLPALYISGYLETAPPPGMPRRIGADASHAWISAFCPGVGWIDVDPTNNLIPSQAHVTLARGLDYSDVSPLRGVILGGGGHSLQVYVDVARVAGGEGARG